MKFVGGRFKTVTPKAKTVVNKFVNALDKDELNALKKEDL